DVAIDGHLAAGGEIEVAGETADHVDVVGTVHRNPTSVLLLRCRTERVAPLVIATCVNPSDANVLISGAGTDEHGPAETKELRVGAGKDNVISAGHRQFADPHRLARMVLAPNVLAIGVELR